MKQTISKHDFVFTPKSFGAYTVQYISPITGKTWEKYITDMTIIDATKNADDPKQKDLKELKSIIKS